MTNKTRRSTILKKLSTPKTTSCQPPRGLQKLLWTDGYGLIESESFVIVDRLEELDWLREVLDGLDSQTEIG